MFTPEATSGAQVVFSEISEFLELFVVVAKGVKEIKSKV
jgi:methyl coenzyme M reductase beta subunit